MSVIHRRLVFEGQRQRESGRAEQREERSLKDRRPSVYQYDDFPCVLVLDKNSPTDTAVSRTDRCKQAETIGNGCHQRRIAMSCRCGLGTERITAGRRPPAVPRLTSSYPPLRHSRRVLNVDRTACLAARSEIQRGPVTAVSLQ